MPAQPQIPDSELMILCGYQEALSESDDGLAAVFEVIKRRMADRFQSDGTVAGTVLRHAQFSWVEFAMVHGHYTQVAVTPDAIQGRVHTLLAGASHDAAGWSRCAHIYEMVSQARYPGSAQYRAARDGHAVLYANLAILDHHPEWATPARFITKVDHQSFYRV